MHTFDQPGKVSGPLGEATGRYFGEEALAKTHTQLFATQTFRFTPEGHRKVFFAQALGGMLTFGVSGPFIPLGPYNIIRPEPEERKVLFWAISDTGSLVYSTLYWGPGA